MKTTEPDDRRISLVTLTEDTGDPVFEVTIGGGSLNVIPADGRLYIHNLQTADDARLKDLLTLAVQAFDQDIVQIVNVINLRLIDVLDDFRQCTMDVPDSDETLLCLVGRWDMSRHTNTSRIDTNTTENKS